MLVGIHSGKLGKFSKSLKVYEKILDYNNIEHIRLDINEPDFWEKVKRLDLFIFRYYGVTDLKEIARSIMPVIQNYMGIKCFPDESTGWHYDDKIKEYYLLKESGFPIAESYIFWNKEAALDWAVTASYPVVFKLKAGSQSDSVILVKNKKSANSLIKRMFGVGIDPHKKSFNRANKLKDLDIKKFIHNNALWLYRKYKGLDLHSEWEKHKNYILFQEFHPGNTYDTRITVIGNRAYAARRFTRKNDFRASGSGLISFDQLEIDNRFVEIAFDISKKLNFQSMAYDFIYNKDKDPIICEISYTFPSEATFHKSRILR